MKGGYQIIDCKGVTLALDGASKKVEGIYNKVKGLKSKPVFLENITLTETEDGEISKGGLHCNVSETENGQYYLYVFWFGNFAIEVHRDDTIQLLNA